MVELALGVDVRARAYQLLVARVEPDADLVREPHDLGRERPIGEGLVQEGQRVRNPFVPVALDLVGRLELVDEAEVERCADRVHEGAHDELDRRDVVEGDRTRRERRLAEGLVRRRVGLLVRLAGALQDLVEVTMLVLDLARRALRLLRLRELRELRGWMGVARG